MLPSIFRYAAKNSLNLEKRILMSFCLRRTTAAAATVCHPQSSDRCLFFSTQTANATNTNTTSHSPWDDMYSQLQDFVKKHGHARVPTTQNSENPKLGLWLSRQRTLYHQQQHQQRLPQHNTHDEDREYEEDDDYEYHSSDDETNRDDDDQDHDFSSQQQTLSQTQIQKLEDLGMIWHVHGEQWDKHFEDYVEFTKNHAENIHSLYKYNNRLYEWCHRQRQQYRRYQENKPSSLTPERVERLNSVGFQWLVYEEKWHRKYEQLLKFYRGYGHCLVRGDGSNPELYRWVLAQRRQHNKKRLPPERLQMLNKIGFVWNPFDAAWMEKLHELKDFVKENGPGIVPPYETHKVLRRWLVVQIRYYRYKQEGKTTSLTDDRVARLQKLGYLMT